MMSEFEKIVDVNPAFDKRHADPKKNYGIGGMTLRFILKGELGATQFVVYTPMHLPHVQRELISKGGETLSPMGADIGVHSFKPMFEGHEKMDCNLSESGFCYYDGSGLQADEFMSEFLEGGSDAVWEMLEQRYNLWLVEDQETNHA